jgi:hypothetical protein
MSELSPQNDFNEPHHQPSNSSTFKNSSHIEKFTKHSIICKETKEISNMFEEQMSEDNLFPKRKKRPMKKAPDAPKRFKSTYICFVGENMENAKKELADAKIPVTETMKILAKKWKELPPYEKQRYEIMAEEDKARYFYELSHYSGPMHVPNVRIKKNPVNFTNSILPSFTSFNIVLSRLDCSQTCYVRILII